MHLIFWVWLWTRMLVICNIDQACPSPYNVSSDQQSCKKRIYVKRFSISIPFQCLLKFNLNRNIYVKGFSICSPLWTFFLSINFPLWYLLETETPAAQKKSKPWEKKTIHWNWCQVIRETRSNNKCWSNGLLPQGGWGVS